MTSDAVPSLPKVVYRVAHAIHRDIGKGRRALTKGLGIARPFRIVPYRGFGTPSGVTLTARVLEDRGEVSPRLDRGLVGGAVASFVRFNTAEVPGAEVRVTWAGQEYLGVTDEEGFLNLAMTPPAGIDPGWHSVDLCVVGPGAGRLAVRERVFVLGDDAEYGVITDVDDTVIDTDVRNIAKRAWALFMSEAARRRTFVGVEALYDALARGPAGGPVHRNPMVYVSSSPWNLYEHLEHFIDEHDLPRGPILLRDWGLTRDGFAPGGGHGHKRKKMKAVLEAFGELPFVLIGDSGQEDAEHYLALAEHYGARIRVIYIRRVREKPGRQAALADLAVRVRAAGSDLVVIEDSAALAADAARRGLLPQRAAAAVARATR